MKAEEMRNSIIPNVAIFAAILYLIYLSGLSVSRAVDIQNQATMNFMSALTNEDILLAIFETLKFILIQAVLPILPFLLLGISGVIVLMATRTKLNMKVFFILEAALLAVSVALSGFSVVVIFICVGFAAISIYTVKSFEEQKSHFQTAQNMAWKSNDWLNIAIALGFFLAIYLNFPAYQQSFLNSNMNMIRNFMPDNSKIEDAQVQLINGTIDGIKASFAGQCNQADPQVSLLCQSVYDSISRNLDAYKENATRQVITQKISNEELQKYVMDSFPAMGQVIKAMPLILALSVFAFLEVLKPFIAFAFAGSYSLARRKSES
jgi:hypothetical protein